MRDRKLLDQSGSTTRERQQDLAAIGAAAHALQQTVKLQAVHQFDGAVMLDLQPLRERAHGGLLRARQTSNRQEGLMLLGLDARDAGSLLAEIDESANFVAELRERPIVEVVLRACLHRSL